MQRFAVHVGWTSARPVRPEQHVSQVNIMAVSGQEAEEVALAMVAGRRSPAGQPHVVMPTSSVVVDWEEGAP